MARCTTAADGKATARGLRITVKSQNPSANAMAAAPAMGRKTKGGLEITSNPFSVVPTGDEVGDSVMVTVGVGDGDSLGVGEGDGDACGPCSVKFAHGFGSTLAQRWCTPAESPANGLTRVLKLPPASDVVAPATWPGWSQ